jgi:hypothetical protein
MKRSFSLISVLFLFVVSISNAQERHVASPPPSPSPRRQVIVIDIESRILEDGRVIWTETNRSISVPGVPVGIQLVGSNLVVEAQFTPYTRREGSLLVAQGRIWIADENTGIVTYYTSIQTIPMELGEPIYFYPLGSSQHLNPSIEIKLTVKPYEGDVSPRRRSANPGNDR